MISPAAAAVLRFARRDLRAHRGRTALAVSVVAVASSLAATTAAAIARTLAPGSTVAQSTDASQSATGTVDAHVVDFLLIVAFIALVLMVLLVVPVFLTGFRRQVRQLGQLAAAGAAPRHLVGAVLAPAAAIGSAGALIGAAVGYVAGSALTPAPGAPSTGQLVVPGAAVLVLALAIVVLCLGCALYPARQAARLHVIDAVRGRGPGTPSTPRVALVAGLLAGVPAVALLRSGARTAAMPGLLTGLLLASVSLCCLVALMATAAAAVRVPRSFAATFAMRDASRHLLRVVPGTGAGAAILATLVAGVVFAGSTSASEASSHVPIAPMGGAFVVGASQADVVAAVERVAPVTAVADVRVLEPGAWSALTDQSVAPVVLDQSPTELTQGRALVADAAVLDLFDIDAGVREQLAAGVVAIRSDMAPAVSDGYLRVQVGVDVVSLPASASLAPRAPAGVIVPEDVAELVAADIVESGVVVTATRTLTAQDGEAISAALGAGWVSVEAGSVAQDSAPTQYLLIGVGGALVFVVIWLLAALARDESRADAGTLEAVGAAPRFARRVASAQAFVQATLAVLAGVPAGLALGQVLLRLRSVSVPAIDVTPSVPWGPLGLAVLALPVMVAGCVALVAPRPSVVARRGD